MIPCVKVSCQSSFRTIYLPRDTWLFEGWPGREFDPETKRYRVFHEGDKTGRTETISFYTSKLDSTVKSYANPNGYVAIYRAKRSLQLVAQINYPADPNCALFFVGKEDYQSDAAQCFCEKTNGYATVLLNEDKKLTNITDIAICSAEKVLEPIGYMLTTEPGTIRKWTNHQVMTAGMVKKYRNSVGLNLARNDILPFKTILGLD